MSETVATGFAGLIEELEDRFGIYLPDRELAGVRTVSDLHERVRQKVLDVPPAAALELRALSAVRRVLSGVLNIPRRTMEAESPLAPLAGTANRAELWRRLEAQSGLRFPPLRTWNWERLAAAGVAVLALGYFTSLGWPWTGVAGGVMAFAGLLGLQRAPLVLPAATVGDLARQVLALNEGQLRQEPEGWTEAELWEAFTQALADFTGAPRERIRTGFLLVRD
jgi:hypothetical protein